MWSGQSLEEQVERGAGAASGVDLGAMDGVDFAGMSHSWSKASRAVAPVSQRAGGGGFRVSSGASVNSAPESAQTRPSAGLMQAFAKNPAFSSVFASGAELGRGLSPGVRDGGSSVPRAGRRSSPLEASLSRFAGGSGAASASANPGSGAGAGAGAGARAGAEALAGAGAGAGAGARSGGGGAAGVSQTELAEPRARQRRCCAAQERTNGRLVAALVQIRSALKEVERQSAGERRKLEMLQDYCVTLEGETASLRAQLEQARHEAQRVKRELVEAQAQQLLHSQQLVHSQSDLLHIQPMLAAEAGGAAAISAAAAAAAAAAALAAAAGAASQPPLAPPPPASGRRDFSLFIHPQPHHHLSQHSSAPSLFPPSPHRTPPLPGLTHSSSQPHLFAYTPRSLSSSSLFTPTPTYQARSFFPELQEPASALSAASAPDPYQLAGARSAQELQAAQLFQQQQQQQQQQQGQGPRRLSHPGYAPPVVDEGEEDGLAKLEVWQDDDWAPDKDAGEGDNDNDDDEGAFSQHQYEDLEPTPVIKIR